MTWTAKLKSGLVFSDGSPVNADAVVWSIKRILDPEFPGNSAEMFVGLTPSGVRKVDDLTVEFKLDTPNAVFPEALASRESNIVPSTWTLENAIGSGPFTLKSWTAGQQMEFVPNANYWGEGPYVDSLTVIEYPEPTARLNALLSGEIDWAGYMDGAQLQDHPDARPATPPGRPRTAAGSRSPCASTSSRSTISRCVRPSASWSTATR